MALQIIGARALSLLLFLGLALFPAVPSLADIAPLHTAAQPLFAASANAATETRDDHRASASGSLFSGTASGSLFAPLPPRDRSSGGPRIAPSGGGPIAQLLSLIAQAEAGSAGYNAVQHGAHIRPSRQPTQMTLAEIYAWIDATPGQPHAIGRYQFIPPTLRRVAREAGIPAQARFTPAVQDALALVLLEDAGLRGFEAGTIGRRQFMHSLARIWAGLPLPDGRSYYEGFAGNRASMSWDVFDRGVRRIWPSG